MHVPTVSVIAFIPNKKDMNIPFKDPLHNLNQDTPKSFET